jgi:RNA polymerase sigma-70 factor (ECF subfamily)
MSGSPSLESPLRLLMLEALEGNEKSYQSFLLLSSKLVRSYLWKVVPSSKRDVVEDLVQEVLISLHRKRHTYRTDAPILPWLFAIAKYRLIDHARALKVRPELLSWDPELDEKLGDGEMQAEQSAQADEDAETHVRVETLLGTLPKAQSDLIRMAKLEGLPLEEVAKRTSLSLANVKVSLHRSLKKLGTRARGER